MEKEVTPLIKLPLHLISDIIASLDRYHDLSSAIRAHSVFYTAYKQHSRSIDARILENRIPPNLLPYALLLLKSRDVQPKNTASVLEFLTLYRDTLTRRAELRSHFSGRRAAFLCRQYEAIEFLGAEYAQHATDSLWQTLCIWVDIPLSPAEKFRVHRALFRHQILVNALCHQGRKGEDDIRAALPRDFHTIREALHRDFYGIHAPWVNRQYVCVHEYITRRLEEAVTVTASYDVYWAFAEGSWCPDFIPRHYMSYAFSLGLPFLARVFSGHGYDHWIKFLQPKPADYHVPRALRGRDTTIGWDLPRPTADARSFVRDADDAYDDLATGPSQAWIEVRKFKGAWDKYLWEAGYVMWDLPAVTFSRRGPFALAINRQRRWYEDYGPPRDVSYSDGGMSTVEWRRKIWRQGGRGFYSTDDFRGVKGLTEEDIEHLLRGGYQ